MFYEDKLKPYEESHEFPYMLNFNQIYLRTDQNARLEERDINILQCALSCRASGRDSELGLLWDVVVDQSKLLPAPELLLRSFVFALGTAAAAGDRQGYHTISSDLQKSLKTLRARKLTPQDEEPRESEYKELRRLRGLWYRLATLHEAADASSVAADASKCASITESIIFDVEHAPKKGQPTMVWLVTHYTMSLFQNKAFMKISPVPSSFLE